MYALCARNDLCNLKNLILFITYLTCVCVRIMVVVLKAIETLKSGWDIENHSFSVFQFLTFKLLWRCANSKSVKTES